MECESLAELRQVDEEIGCSRAVRRRRGWNEGLRVDGIRSDVNGLPMNFSTMWT
ncbi:MAG: hypothetical protein ACSHYF_05365 [Verrucomicrobiaceae bacterium]